MLQPPIIIIIIIIIIINTLNILLLLTIFHSANCVLFLYTHLVQPTCIFILLTALIIVVVTIDSEWIKSLSDDAVKGFQRAAQIGVELNEAWIVVNAAVYLWNYTNHMLTQQRFREVVPIYTPVLETLKETGHAG